jgi:hypothetical protein
MSQTLTKRILCLGNSRKTMGTCIAGKELTESGPGPWIRPISHRPKQEISLYERQFEDGTEPKLLDIIHVPLLPILRTCIKSKTGSSLLAEGGPARAASNGRISSLLSITLPRYGSTAPGPCSE